MAESERMEALHAEIGRFVHEQLQREGVVTGWVLGVSTMRFEGDSDDPLYTWDYSCGPGTDLIRAVGLVNCVKLDMEQMIWNAAREPRPNEDDD